MKKYILIFAIGSFFCVPQTKAAPNMASFKIAVNDILERNRQRLFSNNEIEDIAHSVRNRAKKERIPLRDAGNIFIDIAAEKRMEQLRHASKVSPAEIKEDQVSLLRWLLEDIFPEIFD